MTRRHWVAVAIAVGAMMLAAAAPLWVRVTGDEAFLQIEPVDPRSFFRGNYVDLNYSLGDLDDAVYRLEDGSTFYAVFTHGRPAEPVSVHTSRPKLVSGQFCIAGQARNGPRFPSLEQYFLPTDQAQALERNVGRQLARISVTGRCSAVLIDIVAA